MTPKSPPREKLRMLPGGQRTGPRRPSVEAALPLEARMATEALVEALSETELTAMLHNLVLLPIQTSPWGMLDIPAWRKLADVLLSELLRRREAPAPAEPAPPC